MYQRIGRPLKTFLPWFKTLYDYQKTQNLVRLFKKLHRPTLLAWVPQGIEERGLRRTLLCAAVTNDEDNAVDGAFSTAC